MWSRSRYLRNLLFCSKHLIQTERTTYILKPLFPVKLNKMGVGHSKKARKKNLYYEVISNTDIMKKDPLSVVLLKDVPGVGSRGEKIDTNMYAAYRDLLLPKLALYADLAQAQDLIGKKEEEEYSSLHTKSVEKFLSTQSVAITLSADREWTLEKWHVKFSLRKIGVLTNEECITIPKEIKGPNPDIENRDFLIELTMNKKEKFLLRCRIYHWSTSNPHLNKKIMDVDSPSEPLFSDEKEKIDEIIKYNQEVRKKKMMSGIQKGIKCSEIKRNKF